jgi:hypothetical protein
VRILLITPAAAGGHHLEYKALLEKAFTELGHEVFHFSNNNEKIRKITQLASVDIRKSNYISKTYAKFVKHRISQWQVHWEAIKNWRLLSDHIHNLQKESNRPDLLFFECLDALLGQYLTNRDIERKFTIPFSGILFSPTDTRLIPKSIFSRGLFDPYHILKGRLCQSIGVLMEESVPMLSSLIQKPVIELPDIVSVPESIQDNSLGESIRNRANGRFIIGIWGALQTRKGTSDFLKMCLNLPSEQFFFAMGGKISHESWPANDEQIFKQSASGNIENLAIFDRWLSDDDLLSGMASCDLIFAAYPGWKFTSGIIGKSAALKIPLLVNDGFIMDKRVRDFNIGFVKDEQADTTVWVLNNIIAIKELRNSSSFNEGCLKYCERYGYEQWRKSLAHLIETSN